MNNRQGPGAILLCLGFLLAILTSVLASAHDPLSDETDNPHDGHQSEHDNDSQLRVDLSQVRSLVVSFRETGNDRHLDEAWTLLKPALESPLPGPATLIAAAFVAQSRHEFDAAVQLTEEALAIDDNNDEGWLLLASIQLVRGETEAAATGCRQLRNVPPIVLLTCKARVALSSGQHEAVFARLQGVLNLPDSQRLPPDMLAWSYSVAGDLAVAAGESQQALELYQHSLRLAERSQVRAALVDVLLNEARFNDAWQVLDAGAPALPLLVRRLIAARQLDRMDDLEPELEKVQSEFAVWIADENWLHAREMARFFIDVVERPLLARRLALINVTLQQEPEDLRLEKRTRGLDTRQGWSGR